MSIDIQAPVEHRFDEVLTDEALALVGRLHDELDGTRRSLLEAREERQAELDEGGSLDFVPAPEDFTVAPAPDALQDRRVEITGPTSRKMVINALNSGARGFMADFEDSNSPYWSNMVGGQVNLADAIRRTIEHDEKGKHYELGEETAVLLVRPRGLHLPERHLRGERRRGRRRLHGLRPVRAPQRRGAARARRRAVLLHPEARVGARGAAVARRVRDRRGDARARPRHDQGDGPDRDGARGVRDGRDPVRAARPLGRA